MEIYVVFEIEDGEGNVVNATIDKDTAISHLDSIEFGYVQVWLNGVFIKYYEYDDSDILRVKPSKLFYC